MPKTKLNVVEEAHRRLAVLSVDEMPSDDMTAYGFQQVDALFAELQADPFNMVFAWDADTVPDNLWRPFSWLVAADMANHYQVGAEPRHRAYMRFAQAIYVDDREDTRDIDEDGTVTEAEIEAAKRAQYY